jgi:hypothetical protein
MTRFAGDRFNNIRKFGLDPIEPVGDTFRDIGNAGRDYKRQLMRYDLKNDVESRQWLRDIDEEEFLDATMFSYPERDEPPNYMFDIGDIEAENKEAGNIIFLNPTNPKTKDAWNQNIYNNKHLNLAGPEYKQRISEAQLQGIRDQSAEDQHILINMLRNEKVARLINENNTQAFENRMLFGLINEAPSMNMYDYRESEFNRYRRIKNARKALDNFDLFNRGPEFNRTAPNVKNIDVEGIRKRKQDLIEKRAKIDNTWNTRPLIPDEYEDDIPF